MLGPHGEGPGLNVWTMAVAHKEYLLSFGSSRTLPVQEQTELLEK